MVSCILYVIYHIIKGDGTCKICHEIKLRQKYGRKAEQHKGYTEIIKKWNNILIINFSFDGLTNNMN